MDFRAWRLGEQNLLNWVMSERKGHPQAASLRPNCARVTEESFAWRETLGLSGPG